MGRLQIVISDKLEKRLRKEVAQEGKGAISKAVSMALELWLKSG